MANLSQIKREKMLKFLETLKERKRSIGGTLVDLPIFLDN